MDDPRGIPPAKVREAYHRFATLDRRFPLVDLQLRGRRGSSSRKAAGGYKSTLDRLSAFSCAGLPAGARLLRRELKGLVRGRPRQPGRQFSVELEVPTPIPGHVERYSASNGRAWRRFMQPGKGQRRRPFWLRPRGLGAHPDPGDRKASPTPPTFPAPGQWRSFLSIAESLQIRRQIAPAFALLGYSINIPCSQWPRPSRPRLRGIPKA